MLKWISVLFEKIPERLKSHRVIKSFSEQIKLLSWAIGGVTAFFQFNNKLYSLFVIVPMWVILQYCAHELLAKVKDKEL